MADPLPDPTPAEARALVLGTGIFWAGWGLSVFTLFIHGWVIGVVPFVAACAAGFWLYYGGVYHVGARHEGATVGGRAFGFRAPPWKAGAWSWMRATTPRYYRRAARSLGWPEGAVLGVLAALLASDLALFVWLMATAPSGARA